MMYVNQLFAQSTHTLGLAVNYVESRLMANSLPSPNASVVFPKSHKTLKTLVYSA